MEQSDRQHGAADLEAEKRRIYQYMRNIFASPEGQEVLKFMLSEMGLWKMDIKDEDVPLRNYAAKMLHRLAGDNKRTVVDSTIAGLFKPIKTQ